MKLRAYLFFLAVSLLALKAFAIDFTGRCQGRDLSLNSLVVEIQGSTEPQRNVFGPTSFKVVNHTETMSVVDLKPDLQQWLRETEQGVTFFGVYSQSTFRSAEQTVYVLFSYNLPLGLHQTISYVARGALPPERLYDLPVLAQIFGDKSRAHSMQLSCNFELN